MDHEEDNGYKFTFQGGKWVLEEFFGANPLFNHGSQRDGLIESLLTKLKEVYTRYLEVLDENERDIVDCGWSNYRMSEKTLINLMERRIKGEEIVLPEGYFLLGI